MHHIDKIVSINYVIVCATLVTSVQQIFGGGCIHHSTMKYTKSMHFMLKYLVFKKSWSLESSVP